MTDKTETMCLNFATSNHASSLYSFSFMGSVLCTEIHIASKKNRRVGRPRKRWVDDINKFVKPDETEETIGNDLKNNDTWLKAAKDQRWKGIEKENIKNS